MSTRASTVGSARLARASARSLNCRARPVPSSWAKVSLEGPQKDGEEAFHRENGTRREAIWLQSTPQGDVAVVYWEGEDAQRFQSALSALIASDEPFGRFVGASFADIFGVDPSAGLPPLPDKVRDYRPGSS